MYDELLKLKSRDKINYVFEKQRQKHGRRQYKATHLAWMEHMLLRNFIHCKIDYPVLILLSSIHSITVNITNVQMWSSFICVSIKSHLRFVS